MVVDARIMPPFFRRFWDLHNEKLHGDGITFSGPPEQFFNQTLDHFDVLAPNTLWPQRFWINSTYFNGGESPVFLYIEGEGAGSANSVVSGEHVEYAKTYGALLVSLEHRYYGASIPTADLTTTNMRYLSSHQALADIAEFYSFYLKPTFGLTASNKVITFGGSYPGALSAWARLRLPHIVHGAVATSSPIQTSFDDVSYNDVVADSLKYPLIGGSPACLSSTTQAFEAIDAAFSGTPDLRHAMASKLLSCTGLDAQNDTMWAASNYGSFVQGLVQYNLEGRNSVADFCAEMTKAGRSPIDSFAAVIATAQGGECMDNSYKDYLSLLQNTTADAAAGGLGLRQWTWQCCTQFSYWQDCDPDSQCPLSKKFMTLDSNTQQCQDAFGESVSYALNEKRTQFTNAYMGGQQIVSSNIIVPNGDVDPWHALSLYNITPGSAGPAVTPVFIKGTAHCRNVSVDLVTLFFFSALQYPLSPTSHLTLILPTPRCTLRGRMILRIL